MQNKESNKNAHIQCRQTRTGNLRTETTRRDDELTAALTTDSRNNSTSLFIDMDGVRVKMDGRKARTLYRLLARHYAYTGKSLAPLSEAFYW